MQIVDKFMEQGIDYWSTEIPDSVIETIKHLYPDMWEEYIKVY